MRSDFSPVLADWLVKPLPRVIPRQDSLKIEEIGLLNKALVVTGFRRSGKTYLLFEAVDKLLTQGLNRREVVYINFEDERLNLRPGLISQLLEQIKIDYGGQVKYLFLDELQNVPDWSKWLRRILDEGQVKVAVTGSSSRLSSYELPTELRGRSWDRRVYPLSYTEFLRFGGQGEHEYLKYGGFPEIVLSPEEKKLDLAQNYFQTVVRREMVERFKVRREENLKLLLKLLLNTTYFTLSKAYANLKSMGFKVGKTALNQYLGYAEASYFVKQLYRHNYSLKNRLLHPRKIYPIDNVFITALSTKFSANWGRKLENAVYWQLAKRWEDLAYWRSDSGKEADFVVLDAGKTRTVYQVCFDLEDPETRQREVSGLLAAGRDLGCDDLVLISTQTPANLPQNIKFITFLDFLAPSP